MNLIIDTLERSNLPPQVSEIVKIGNNSACNYGRQIASFLISRSAILRKCHANKALSELGTGLIV